MDSHDLKALTLLATRGRASWAELAKKLNFSAPSAADRVRRLEKRGIIQGYEARMDPKRLGYSLTAFVAVTLARNGQRAKFLRAIARTPEILECHHVTGDPDYLLKVRCKDTSDLERVITRQLKRWADVRTRSTIVMSTVRETAVLPVFAAAAPRRPKGAG